MRDKRFRTLRGRPPSGRAVLALLIAVAPLAGCSRPALQLELTGQVLYEKPKILEVSHTVIDARPDGGVVALEVVILGDPGLRASFDILPDVAAERAMRETVAGKYVGRFEFEKDALGGPFTVLGRLRHDQAGEVNRRDPDLVLIPLFQPGS